MTVADEVRGFLVEQERLGVGEAVGDDESLLERGVIDSVGILELVAFLEDRFEIAIDDEDLMPENFETLAAISSYVAEKLG